jgi:hypothetical protein
MKKNLLIILLMIVTVSLYALVIPTGDNVRAADVAYDGDSIVGVQLGGDEPVEITTPIGKLKAANGTWVNFYKSGNLRSFMHSPIVYKENNSVRENITGAIVETPLGQIALQSSEYRFNQYLNQNAFAFFESGSPKLLNMTGLVTINGTKYYIDGGVSFYDSGAADKWLLSKFYTNYYKNDEGNYVSETEYVDDKKNVMIRNHYNYDGIVELWKDQTLKSAILAKSPSCSAIVNGNEVFIKGKEGERIVFHQNGNVASFVADEVVVTQQDGLKLVIPAGKRIDLYDDGKIKTCLVSNPNVIKVKSKEYLLKGKRENSYNQSVYDIYLFSADGNLCGFSGWIYRYTSYSGKEYESTMDQYIADVFYDDGSIKRIRNFTSKTNFCNNYGIEWDSGTYDYVESFYNPAGAELKLGAGSVSEQFIYFKTDFKIEGRDGVVKDWYNLQKGDMISDVANIIFDAKGIPESYTMLKFDEDKEKMLDMWGMPIEDPHKKNFILKERR